jgi:hypothetical protein
MSKSTLGAVGLGLVGLGSTLIASPAHAALSCGTTPTGGSILATNDYCQLTFSTSGSYSVTVPSSASELYAILVGSGSGAGADQSNNVAYAGSGGQVKYINLSDQIDTPITVNVGAGGASSTNQSATPGTDTTLIYSSTGASAWTGNVSNSDYDSCNLPTYTSSVYSYIMYMGKDAKLTDRVASYTDSCTNGFGLGVNPSAGNTDSDNHPVPAIFADYNAHLGAGGQISTNLAPAAAGFGAGGSYTVSDTDLTFSNVQAGHDGAVIFRWKQGELGNTGSNYDQFSGWAASLIGLGASLLMASRTRRRAAK